MSERVHVEGGDVDVEDARHVAGIRGRLVVGGRAAADDHADRSGIDAGPPDCHPGRPGAELGRGVGACLRRGADVAVACLSDVVEAERGAPRADPDALEDPLVARPDVELLEEAVRDFVLGVKLPDSV